MAAEKTDKLLEMFTAYLGCDPDSEAAGLLMQDIDTVLEEMSPGEQHHAFTTLMGLMLGHSTEQIERSIEELSTGDECPNDHADVKEAFLEIAPTLAHIQTLRRETKPDIDEMKIDAEIRKRTASSPFGSRSLQHH